ncbi:MAG: response regulator [Melioribacteraceae bacterium]|nr:response regulator [Melioribacteraceae bacterium]MCF8353036.1 response regulator [Melioribacteraceae bacterium]MCF8392927.1 response regulator [Melioribacteraceae bacterium]MCF8417778.1 response regulator [Melioribacteraceae bacterium]
MSKIKILVVEDEAVTSMQITNSLETLGYNVLEPVTNYEDAVKSLINNEPDIAILDIELEGEKSGIDLAAYIKENISIPFIFLTTKSDPRTIDHAKRLNPPAYLMKPFSSEDLYASIEIALYNFHPSKQKLEHNYPIKSLLKKSIFIKDNNLFHKINLTDILYAKSDHVYVELFTNSGKSFLIRTSMGRFFEDLPENFFRVHRSYTINLNHLDSINSLYTIIKGKQIPIGKNYRDRLMTLINIK